MGKRWRKKRRKILNDCGRIKKNHTKHSSQKSLVTDGNSSNRISLLKNIIWGYNYKSIDTTMVCIVNDEHIHKNIKKKNAIGSRLFIITSQDSYPKCARKMWVIARFILETRNYDQIEKSFYLREMKMYNRIKNGVKAWTKGMGGEKKNVFPFCSVSSVSKSGTTLGERRMKMTKL